MQLGIDWQYEYQQHLLRCLYEYELLLNRCWQPYLPASASSGCYVASRDVDQPVQPGEPLPVEHVRPVPLEAVPPEEATPPAQAVQSPLAWLNGSNIRPPPGLSLDAYSDSDEKVAKS